MATKEASVSTQKGFIKSGTSSFKVGSFENMFLSFLNAASCSLDQFHGCLDRVRMFSG